MFSLRHHHIPEYDRRRSSSQGLSELHDLSLGLLQSGELLLDNVFYECEQDLMMKSSTTVVVIQNFPYFSQLDFGFDYGMPRAFKRRHIAFCMEPAVNTLQWLQSLLALLMLTSFLLFVVRNLAWSKNVYELVKEQRREIQEVRCHFEGFYAEQPSRTTRRLFPKRTSV
ncbi:hypothetical protein F2Q68_00018708 [Brassica cretica]|uniref:Uncharacterized protein n=1 Tax=Brassica cretica TaxID=69181 RepID=A0A8S9G2R3_BRACR|nr:hypothetical protein F2Q68_00018708 [Brassica cretica]